MIQWAKDLIQRRVIDYTINRLSENSTWSGIVLSVAGSLGLTLTTTKEEALIALGLAIGGAIKAFLPDKLFSKN